MENTQNKSFLRIALLSAMFISQLNTIASVIMADLFMLFPDASPTAIQMVMQFGMVGSFPVALTVGFLANRIRVKPMILIGMVCMLIGGLMPLLMHETLGQLYISALIIGAGEGFIAPLVSTLTLRFFENRARDRQIGLNSTFATGGATIFTIVAGVIALGFWLDIYYLYLFAIPALIIVIVFMPRGEIPAQPVQEEKKEKVPVPPRVFVQAGLLILMYIGYITFPINVGILTTAEKGFGDSASTGLSVSIVTVVGAAFGLVFPYVIKFLKSYIGLLSCVCCTAGLLIAGFATSMAVIYGAAVLLGCFWGSAVAGAVYIVGRMCKPQHFGPSLSIVMAFMTLGIILSPIVVNAITPLWRGRVDSEGAFITSAAIMCVAFVLQIIWGTFIKKNFPEKPSDAPEEDSEEAPSNA